MEKKINSPRITVTRSEYQGKGTLYVRVEVTREILYEWLKSFPKRKAFIFALREEDVKPEESG